MTWRSFLPRWFERKASTTNKAVLLTLTSPGPVEHVKYDRLSKETYERNITIYRCVTFLSRAVAGVPWVLMKRGTAGAAPKRIISPNGWKRLMASSTDQRLALNHARLRKAVEMSEVETHPLLTLLEKPNPKMAQADYFEIVTSYLLLAGNSYEEFLRPARAKAAPLELWPLRPDRMKVVPNTERNRLAYPALAKGTDPGEQLVLGFTFEANSTSRPDELRAENVLHRKLFHPTDDWYGLSPLQVATRAWQTDNKLQNWQVSLVDNEMRPSGVLMSPTNSDEKTYKRMEKAIVDNWVGAKNAGMPLYLEGGLEWIQLSLTPMELDFLDSMKFTRVQLCSLYGVAPELVGDPDHKTFNSFPEARRSTYQDAVLPLLDRIRDSYNNQLVPFYGDGLFLDYDRDQIEALQEDRNQVWARVKGADHISIQEQRVATGYDEADAEDEEQETALTTPRALLNLAAQQDAAEAAEEEDGEREVREKMVAAAQKLAATGIAANADALAAAIKELDAATILERRLSPAQRKRLRRLRKNLSKLFEAQGAALARHLAE